MSGVPKLRFAEFDGAWSRSSLDDMGTTISDGNYGELYPRASQFSETGVPFIRANNLKEGSVIWKDMRFISADLHSVLLSGHLKTGDILVTTRGEIGSISLVSSEFSGANINAQICLLRDANACDEYFLFLSLIRHDTKRQFIELTTGSALQQLPRKNLKKIEIGFPPLPEQKKIADFLGAVDEKIAGLREQERLLTDYKKGVMQKIFAQDIRFKADDGSDFPDWRKIELGEVCEITTGRLDANAAVSRGQFPFFTCAKDVFAIDTAAFDTEALLISGNGANVGYIHYCNGKFNAYQRTYVLDKFDANIFYVEQYLKKNLRKRIYSEAKEGNTPYIVMGTLTELPVQLPHPDEQQKIADFLSAIDDKITAVSAQISHMQDFKTGLLQQMFV